MTCHHGVTSNQSFGPGVFANISLGHRRVRENQTNKQTKNAMGTKKQKQTNQKKISRAIRQMGKGLY